MGAAARAAPTRTRACRAADGPGGAPPVGEQRAGGRPYTASAIFPPHPPGQTLAVIAKPVRHSASIEISSWRGRLTDR